MRLGWEVEMIRSLAEKKTIRHQEKKKGQPVGLSLMKQNPLVKRFYENLWEALQDKRTPLSRRDWGVVRLIKWQSVTVR